VKEISALRTENSKTYDLGGGKFRRVISNTLHYKDDYNDPAEPWKDVNLNFVDGRIDRAPYILEVNELTIELTSKKTGTIQTLTLERIGSEKPKRPVLWQFVKNKAVWEHAAPNTDVVIEAGPSFVRVKRILHSITAPLEAEFNHTKVVGKTDDITLHTSARDANGEPLPVIKSDVAGKLTEALDISDLVLKEGKLYHKLQYPDGEGGLIEELVEVKFPIVIDPTLTVQPSAKDTHLLKSAPTTNYSSLTYIQVNWSPTYTTRPILEFDISGLPAGATLNSASLELYNYSGNAALEGQDIWAYKQLRIDWVESEACWNYYKGTTVWTAAGGDFITSDPAGASAPAPTPFTDYGWMTWDVLAIVQDAYNSSIAVEFLLKFLTETGGNQAAGFRSNNYTNDTNLCPKLVIDYTVPAVGRSYGFIIG